MNELNFEEFTPVSAKAWKQHIQFHLKGLDYNDTLSWTSSEGISIKPFYHKDTVKAVPLSAISTNANFNICDTIEVLDVAKANAEALKAINAGANSIKFCIKTTGIAYKDVLNGIDTTAITVYFDFNVALQHVVANKIQIELANTYCTTDIIGNLAKTGNWYANLKADFLNFSTFVTQTQAFHINVSLYENAGATIVQQLAYTMGHANEYFNHFENSFKDAVTTPITVVFNVSIGSNYFFEIAKLKALRLLFNSITKHYSTPYRCHIFALPTKRNKTIYDAYTNSIRSTTECMSAVLGGADTISNTPHNATFKTQDASAKRLARNQLLLLKHEGYFDAVHNPTDGSYYIETLTTQLAESTLNLFKNIELSGGFLKQLKEGTVQRKLKESATKEEQLFNTKEKTIVGCNAFTNPNERLKDSIEKYPFLKKEKRKTLIPPIIEKRLTQNLEKERLKKE